MAGQVPEPVKKRRAAELLAMGAAAKAGFARASLGTTTRLLVEQRLADGRWVGHAEDHVLVAVTPRPGDPGDLENAILRVRRTAMDGTADDRVAAEILDVDPAPRALRARLAVLA
jgi:tRNA A37 methylthiotransferase MiaB